MAQTVKETPSQRFDSNLPPKHQSVPYPVVDPDLPKLFPCAVFCGSVNSGKTSQACRLITKYIELGARDLSSKRQVFQRVILFSPSIDANPVWSAIPKANLDLSDRIAGYSDDRLQILWDQIKVEKQQLEAYHQELKLYKDCTRSKKTPSQPVQDWLESLDYRPPEPRCQYPQGCIYHVILDDCLGMDRFKNQGKSAFTTFCLARRYLSVCIYLCTQSMRQIPRRLRQSISFFCLFKYASAEVLVKDFHTEVSNVVTISQFITLYDYAVRERHDFLIVDLSQPSDRTFRRGWTHFISL